MIDALPDRRKTDPRETKKYPYGVAFVGSHPFSPYTILGEVLGKKGYGISIRPDGITQREFVAVAVSCATDEDAKVYEFLRFTPELSVLEGAFANGSIFSSDNLVDYSDERLILPYYDSHLDIVLQRCFWPEATQDRVKAYWWDNLSRNFYGNNLRMLEEIQQLQVLEQSLDISRGMQEHWKWHVERKTDIAERLRAAALKSKNKSREILIEKSLQPLTSKDLAALIDEVIEKRLSSM